MSDPRYPLGPYQPPEVISADLRREWLGHVAALPGEIRTAVAGLDDSQLDTPYREGGWTVRQVVHHLPDSHTNAYVRFKLALTEDEPLIRPYLEERWALLPEAAHGPLDLSLDLLEALHRRWTVSLAAVTEAQWPRAYRHPEMGLIPLDRALGLYAWHGRHHLAHINTLRTARGW